MIGPVCPPKNSLEYKKLESLVGEYSALRIWTQHLKSSSDNDPDKALDSALEKFDIGKFSIAEKRRIIEEMDNTFEKPKDDVEDETYYPYKVVGTGEEYERMSKVLDRFKQTEYRHPTGDPIYSETGKAFHDVPRMTNEGYNYEVIKKTMEDTGIPLTFYAEMRTFLDDLIKKGGGTILTEKKLVSHTSKIAGQSDVIHLKADGTVDVYDFKTAYWTPSKLASGQKPWDPIKYDHGYKAKRYTAQLDGYGRMLEEALGQPVSNYFIVPIEVWMDDTGKKVKNYKIHPIENTNDYGETELSRSIMDEVFDYQDISGYAGIKIDVNTDTGQFINKLTGVYVNYNVSAIDNARDILQDAIDKKQNGWWHNNKFNYFQKGATEAQKLDQITRNIDTVISSDRAYSAGVQNFLRTGESKFLDAFGKRGEELKTIFGQYLGRTVRQKDKDKYIPRNDIKVIDLSSSGKKGWIAIKSENNYDLYYLTEDNLDLFVRNGKSSTGLFAEMYPRPMQHHTYLKTKLENKYGDAKVFEAVLLAMKLKELDAAATFGNIQLYSIHDKGGVYGEGMSVSLREHLPTVKALWNNSASKDSMPKDMTAIFNNPKFFDEDNYNQDVVRLYSRLTTQQIIGTNKAILEGVNMYLADASNKKRLSDVLAKEIVGRVDIGRTQEVDMETMLLAKMYFQLNKIYQSSYGLNFWENYFSASQNQSDPLFQRIYMKQKQAIGRIQQYFWYEYKARFDKIYKSIVDDAGGIFNAPRDYTIGDTTRYFEPLFEKQVMQTAGVSGEAVPKEMNTFRLWDEGSPGFNKLSKAQQNAIVELNKLMMEVSEMSGLSWKKGNLPIVRADFYNRIYNARKEKGMAGYREAVGKVLDDVTDIFAPNPDADEKSFSNVFLSQAKDNQRKKLLQISSDNFVNETNYNNFSTNLEVMMDAFMIQGLKHEAFLDTSALIKSAVVINTWAAHNLLNRSMGVKNEHLKEQHIITIDNRDPDSDKPISGMAKGVSKVISSFSLGFKPLTAVVNFLGIEFTHLSQSIANTVTNTGGFTLGTSTKAHALAWAALGKKGVGAGELYDKVSELMTRFRLHNQDLSSALNGYHRVSDNTMFSSKALFSLMNGADWMARSTIMISQMIHDGTWDAYSIAKDPDGKSVLVYDESKDERFKKLNDKEAAAMKRSILAQQKEDRTGDGVTLKDGYDSRYMTRMIAQANELAGAMNREDRNNAHFSWWGRMFTFFKTWFPIKLDKYFSHPMGNLPQGNMVFEEDEKGNVHAVWSGSQMEGIFQTLVYTAFNLDKIIKGELPITVEQKNNLARGVSDIIIIALLTATVNAMADDDDDDEWDEMAQKVLTGAVGDLTAIYQLMKLDEFYYTPHTLTFLKQRINNVFNIVAGAADPDANIMDDIVRVTPGGGQFEQWFTAFSGQKLLEE